MKKRIPALLLCLAMVFSLAACGGNPQPSPSASTPGASPAVTPSAAPSPSTAPTPSTPASTGLTDGTYTGVGSGKGGDVAVEVTFAGGQIASVTVGEHSETSGIADPALERIPQSIVDNQSVKLDAVAGATLTSNAILDAVKDCITQAGGNVSDFEKEVQTAAVEAVEKEADIVIVGAGAAGLMAALKASREGAKVLVLEKAANAYAANFASCGGPAACETNIQAAEGATVTLEQFYGHLYDFSNTTVDAKLLKNVLARTGEAINSMDDLGVEMFLIPDTYGVGYRARHMFAYDGSPRIDPITAEIEANGGEILYETPGEQILMEDGKAVGIRGTNAEGAPVTVKAGAVLICTGGFQGNEEMLHEHFGDINVVSLGNNLSTGDGINMVLEAGGCLDRNFGVLGNEGGGTTSKIDGPIYTPDWDIANHNLAFWIFGGLLVDMDGDRFINEKLVADFPLALGGEAILRQGKAYAVMSQEYYDACTTGEGIYSYLGQPESWVAGQALWYPVLEKAQDQLQQAIDEGWAYKADTLAECAEHFGLENLEATVAEYNEMCESGEDALFGKDPAFMTAVGEGPYYVFEYESAAWSTFGGVKVDSYLRAVGADGETIPGLYVAGVDTGSYYAVPYYDGEGSCVGIAVGSGIYAAENMLSYIGK